MKTFCCKQKQILEFSVAFAGFCQRHTSIVQPPEEKKNSNFRNNQKKIYNSNKTTGFTKELKSTHGDKNLKAI